MTISDEVSLRWEFMEEVSWTLLSPSIALIYFFSLEGCIGIPQIARDPHSGPQTS